MRSGDRVQLNFGGAPFRHQPPGFCGVADSLEWMAPIYARSAAAEAPEPSEGPVDPAAAEQHALDVALVALPGRGLTAALDFRLGRGMGA